MKRETLHTAAVVARAGTPMSTAEGTKSFPPPVAARRRGTDREGDGEERTGSVCVGSGGGGGQGAVYEEKYMELKGHR